MIQIFNYKISSLHLNFSYCASGSHPKLSIMEFFYLLDPFIFEFELAISITEKEAVFKEMNKSSMTLCLALHCCLYIYYIAVLPNVKC